MISCYFFHNSFQNHVIFMSKLQTFKFTVFDSSIKQNSEISVELFI